MLEQRDLYNYNARCTYVVDGDTVDLTIDAGFKLTTEQRIRMLGINTPEKGQEGYAEAKNYLINRLKDKDVVVETYKSDAFGRYLGVIFLDDININEEMLTKGFAKVFR